MAIVVALVLLVLLLVIGAGFAWQERRNLPERARIYGVEDSIEFVMNGRTSDALDRNDVRRILEWSVRYLQEPSVRSDPDAPVEFAGNDMGRYIQDQAMVQGHGYDGEAIREVLELQAAYLAAIGAIGDRAEDDTIS